MFLFTLNLALSIATTARALVSTGVIFPLYIYPSQVFGDNCTNWPAINQAIAAHPSVPFLIVVNPATGAGSNNSQPDANYQRCIAQLYASGSSANNIKIIGYVDTGFGNLANNLVVDNITTYAQWSTAYRPSGIFFDDVEPSASLLSLYQSYAAQVRSSFGSTGMVVLNPGKKPDTTDYFSFSDLIVTSENFYSQFNTSSLTISPSSPANKQSVILHDGPSTTPSSLVSQLIQLGIKDIFITDFPKATAYENVPTDWVNFVNTVAADQGVA